ncbi:hypothetical protein FKM82_002010 [Ascaphus truei]
MLVPSDDRDSGYGDAVESTPSLWRLVEKQVPVSERAEIKRILGEAAIDLSLELHAEVEVLLGLWREQRSDCPTSDQRSFQSSCSVLADPPVIKDMVTQEIRMLLLSVRQKACRDGLFTEVFTHLDERLHRLAICAERALHATGVLLKEERRVIERDLQLKQSATSSFHSHRKMLTRTSNVSRPLDAVIRSPTENQHRVLSNVRPQSGCLQDNGPKVAPSPPNAKLKVQGIKKSSIVPIASGTRPSPNLPASYRFRSSEKLTAGVGEESVNVISCIASHSPIKNSDIALSRDRIQGLSCPMDDLQKGPAPLLKVMLGQVLPSDCAFVEQTQVVPKLGLGSKGLDAVFVPSPPPVQRPAGGTNSFSTHRRVRTLQSNSSS